MRTGQHCCFWSSVRASLIINASLHIRYGIGSVERALLSAVRAAFNSQPYCATLTPAGVTRRPKSPLSYIAVGQRRVDAVIKTPIKVEQFFYCSTCLLSPRHWAVSVLEWCIYVQLLIPPPACVTPRPFVTNQSTFWWRWSDFSASARAMHILCRMTMMHASRRMRDQSANRRLHS